MQNDDKVVNFQYYNELIVLFIVFCRRFDAAIILNVYIRNINPNVIN